MLSMNLAASSPFKTTLSLVESENKVQAENNKTVIQPATKKNRLKTIDLRILITPFPSEANMYPQLEPNEDRQTLLFSNSHQLLRKI